MLVTRENILSTALERYNQCLEENYQYADSLAKALSCNKGMWADFCKEVNKEHGRTSHAEIRAKILYFLHCFTEEALNYCRRGMDHLQDIYNAIEACTYFMLLICDQNGKVGYMEMIGYSQHILEDAQQRACKAVNVMPAELRGIALKFSRFYLERCRGGHVAQVHKLAAVGALSGIRIEEIGSGSQEVQEWLLFYDMERARKAFEYLLGQPLHELLGKRDAARRALDDMIECLKPAPGESVPPDLWYIRQTSLWPLLDIRDYDVDHIRRIESAYKARYVF